jgi:hypothetical protein
MVSLNNEVIFSTETVSVIALPTPLGHFRVTEESEFQSRLKPEEVPTRRINEYAALPK